MTPLYLNLDFLKSPYDSTLLFDLAFIIEYEHVGHENPGRFVDLARRLGVNRRRLHNLVRSLLVDCGFPVGTTSVKPAGAFLIVSEEDRDVAARHLESRAKKEFVRVAAIRRIPLKEVTQLLFPELANA